MLCRNFQTCAALIAALLLLPGLATAQPQPPSWPTKQWPGSTPEEQGMDSNALAALVDFGAANAMDSLVVTRHGHIVAEAYYAPFKPGMRHRLNSATKGVLAALTGIAISQGKLSDTDRPMVEFFPERNISKLDQGKKSITLQHLLDMQSGLDWIEPLSDVVPESVNAMRRSADWLQFVLDRPMAKGPGAGFNYNSGNSHLLGAILTRQTGVPLKDFASEHLFQPLGILDVRWQRDPQGIYTGGFGLYLQSRDMAKLGYLYLRGGEWDGAQILPRNWVGKVFAARLPMTISATADWRYGDQWWTLPERDAYMAVGYNRQIILVMPRTGVVAALTGRRNYPFEAMLGLVARAVKADVPLAANPQGVALLERRSREVALEQAVTFPSPALAQQISGKTWRVAPNPFGVTAFTLHLGASASYQIERYLERGSRLTRTESYPLGQDGLFSAGDTVDGSAVVSRLRWTGPNTLTVVARRPGEAETDSYELQFFGNRVAIRHTNSFGATANLAGEAGE